MLSRAIAAAFLLCLPGPSALAGDDPGSPEPAGEVSAAEPEPVASKSSVPSVEVSGFVDASVAVPVHGYAPGNRGVVVGLDQAEIDVSAVPTAGLTMRVDLNVFPAAKITFDAVLEQGFVDYVFGGGDEGFFVAAGKRNAPIGVEAIDPTDMAQYSHGLLFSYATPANLTGLFLGWRAPSFEVQAWVTNDWDTFGTPADASVGLRASYTVADLGHVGLSSTFGPVAAGPDGAQLMIDLDTAWTVGPVTVAAEGNFGRLGDLLSFGALLKGTVSFAERFGVTLRADYLNREYGTPIEAASVTGAFLFTLVEGHLGGVAEIRGDVPVADASATSVLAAVELTGSF